MKKELKRRMICFALAGSLFCTYGIDNNTKKDKGNSVGIAYAISSNKGYTSHKKDRAVSKYDIRKESLIGELASNIYVGDLNKAIERRNDNTVVAKRVSDEEILNHVLNYLEMNEEEYQFFYSLFAREREKLGYGFNSIEEMTYKFYQISHMSVSDKMEYIMEVTNLSYDELNTILAVFPAEGKHGYIDVYGTATTLFNRTYRSKLWISYGGDNMYRQVTIPLQYCAYGDNGYLNFLGKSEEIGYKAATDAMYLAFNGYTMHSYLSFTNAGEEQFTPGGAWYHGEIEEDDLLEPFALSTSRVDNNLKRVRTRS